jgi:glyoxylase-like metal-dependent hydrolase (beta-lactamase superfamily II)
MFLRQLIIITLALWSVCGVPSAFAQQSVLAHPEAKSFKLGALEITALHDGGLAIPNNGSIFGLNASEVAVAKVLSAANAPKDKIRLDVDALLIQNQSKFILIDTGYGPPHHGLLLNSLALAGVQPDEISEILITHAHPDHVGGLLDANGRLAFPNATIRMSSREWTFMQSEADSSAEAATIRPQVKTFEPGQPVLQGITPIALPGHTPGHVGYEIESHGHSLLDFGDIAHSSIVSLAKPDWTILWDRYKVEGEATRHRELSKLAATQELIFAPHFPFPGVGRIERSGNGFRFDPELPPN